MTSYRFGVPSLPPYSAQPPAQTVIELWSGSAVFSPQLRLHVDQTSTVIWQWADGTTTANELEPVKDFGSDGVRRNVLILTNPHALELLNLGYDAGDGGPGSIPLRAPQDVRAIVGLQSAVALNYLAVSQNNGLQSLDCSHMPSLLDVESYLSHNVQSVSVVGSSGLRRVCFEDNDLQGVLDLSSCGNLRDLRGAANALTSIVWPPSGMPDLWHMCIQSNGLLTANALPDLSLYPSLRELWIWYCNQSGTLAPHMVASASVIADHNNFTALDLSHVSADATELRVHNNPFEAITWGASGWSIVQFTDCNLSAALVDAALNHLASTGRANGTAYFGGCAAPTAASLAARNSLIAAGWALNF